MNIWPERLWKWGHLPLLLGLLLLLPSFLSAAEVTLAWDQNSESDLAGYKLHYGYLPGEYIQTVDVGLVTEFLITGLALNQGYYFVATAYDADGNESDYSEEIFFAGTFAPPEPASNGAVAFLWVKPQPGMIMGKDYEMQIQPDGSYLFILPDSNAGQSYKWEN